MHFKINPFGEVKNEREKELCLCKEVLTLEKSKAISVQNEPRQLVAPRSSRIFYQNITLE